MDRFNRPLLYKVNDVQVKNLSHLRTLLDQVKTDYIEFRLENDQRILLESKGLAEANQRIKDKYQAKDVNVWKNDLASRRCVSCSFFFKTTKPLFVFFNRETIEYNRKTCVIETFRTSLDQMVVKRSDEKDRREWTILFMFLFEKKHIVGANTLSPLHFNFVKVSFIL